MADRRLLAIDDEKGLLAIVQDIGRTAGYEVVATSDATFFMDVVAEGIETEAQLAALLKRGAVVGQGYVISRPAPADDIFRRFAGNRKGDA